jgi:hypothetical protein
MLVTEAAILPELKFFRMFFLIFGGHVISLFALRAGHSNSDPHIGTSCKTIATFNLS